MAERYLSKEICSWMYRVKGLGYGFMDEDYRGDWGKLMDCVEVIVKEEYEDGDTVYLRTFGQRDEEGNYLVRFNRYGLFRGRSLREALFLAVLDYATHFNKEKGNET